MEISSAQVVVQTKSRRVLNQLNKEISHDILILALQLINLNLAPLNYTEEDGNCNTSVCKACGCCNYLY